MAERPVFVPNISGRRLISEVTIEFKWHPGMALSQKQKNVAELHEAAARRGLSPILEISSKSDREAGRRLSAFHQSVFVENRSITVECAFQGSKVFKLGGPYIDLYNVPSNEAKRDKRLKHSGDLIGFRFNNTNYPLSPPTAFYDWLYLNALYPYRIWLERLDTMVGFSDIEFNPNRSLNCQARSCAIFVSLQKRNQLELALASFEDFVKVAWEANL